MLHYLWHDLTPEAVYWALVAASVVLVVVALICAALRWHGSRAGWVALALCQVPALLYALWLALTGVR